MSKPKSPAADVRPVVEITHRTEFSASHRLHSDELTDEENARVFGICNNLHGHNYELEVTVRGAVDATTGMVMNLTDLMALIRDKILGAVDHRDLNTDVPFLAGLVPTAENIAVSFWKRLEPELERFEGCRLYRIRVYESPSNLVEYFGPTEVVTG